MENNFLTIFQNLTVLIVEDNLSQREKLQEIISLFTDKIVVASDGLEGLEFFEKYTPNIIITDIKMPKLDGLEFAKKVREVNKKIPIIILTAHTDKEYLLKAVSLQLVNYIEKPLSQENLLKNLEEAVETLKKNLLLEVNLQGGYVYNIVEKSIYFEGEKTKLTKKEVLFLELLIKYKNQIVSKDEIEEMIWSDSCMTKAALKNFIFKLRKKIGYESLQTSSSNGFLLKIDD